jgi:hypothetical protein
MSLAGKDGPPCPVSTRYDHRIYFECQHFGWAIWVSLAKGTYEGTIGTFLNFRDDDPKWADILEEGSQIRSHPVQWLEHTPS